MVFLIAGTAETRRLPFDLPEAESELSAGFHAEYSAMKFGMFFVGEHAGITLISAMIVVLFVFVVMILNLGPPAIRQERQW